MQGWWFDDRLGLKSVYLQRFFKMISPLYLKDFININEYANFVLWPCSLALTSTGQVGLWFCGFNVQEHLKAHRQWFWF